jgi:hypothetical protein
LQWIVVASNAILLIIVNLGLWKELRHCLKRPSRSTIAIHSSPFLYNKYWSLQMSHIGDGSHETDDEGLSAARQQLANVVQTGHGEEHHNVYPSR